MYLHIRLINSIKTLMPTLHSQKGDVWDSMHCTLGPDRLGCTLLEKIARPFGKLSLKKKKTRAYTHVHSGDSGLYPLSDRESNGKIKTRVGSLFLMDHIPSLERLLKARLK